MFEQTFGFIGAGQMARALAAGFCTSNLISADRVITSDPSPEAIDAFLADLPHAKSEASNRSVVESTDIVFLAVKPQAMAVVLREIAQADSHEKLFVSIAAGVPLSRLCDGLGTDRVIRVMPNTPCLIRAGAAGFSLARGASQEDGQIVNRLFNSVGIAFELDEPLLDAVTGLSGSGPAFVFQAIESLSDGGVAAGLPREVSTRLAAQTVFGAAAMVKETGNHPGELKDRVTSPAGTTIAGLAELEEHGFRAALISAVKSATQRSRELGQLG